MRLLLDICHPAQVHLFRQLIKKVQQEGGEALAALRDKDVAVTLCEGYGIPHVVLTRAHRGSLVAAGSELVQRIGRLWRLARRFKPDALLGTSSSIGLVGRAMGRPSFVFNEDDARVNRLFAATAYPASTFIVTPECLKYENHGAKHLTYRGYHELAYLHPDHFVPDPAVPASISLGAEKPYFILRLVALRAHHDVGARGMSPSAVKELVELLESHGRVLVTSEGELREEYRRYQFPLHPRALHDVLAFASLYIGDSQTMAAEAAVLGVPSIRCNTFVGRLSYLDELEKRYALTRGFRPDQVGQLATLVREWLDDLPGVRQVLEARKQGMLTECVNVAEWQWKMLSEKLR